MNVDSENKTLISPATTPGSIDAKTILIPRQDTFQRPAKKRKWYHHYNPPFVTLIISALQVIFFLMGTKETHRKLRFDPKKQSELWRFLSYMLLHDSWEHLSINVGLQCLFATFLENTVEKWKVLLVYLSGGIGGALGASCLRPDLLVGASAGVYALLISYVSYFILNFNSIKYRLYKMISLCVVITSDMIWNVVHYYGFGTPTISWGAHIFGALTGFLLGLIIFSNNCENKTLYKTIWYASVIASLAIIAFLINLDVQVRKCSTHGRLRYLMYCQL